jgi:hypothetical protein
MLLVAALALYIAWPLRDRARRAASDVDTLPDLTVRRDTLYRELADLDFDHRLGRVDEEDYRTQREDYLEETSEILRRIDILDNEHTEIRE